MYSNGNGGNNNGIELLSLLLEFYQIYLAYENIDLNNEQIKMLMSEMKENQDKKLAQIIAQNELLLKQNREIINLLKNLDKE